MNYTEDREQNVTNALHYKLLFIVLIDYYCSQIFQYQVYLKQFGLNGHEYERCRFLCYIYYKIVIKSTGDEAPKYNIQVNIHDFHDFREKWTEYVK